MTMTRGTGRGRVPAALAAVTAAAAMALAGCSSSAGTGADDGGSAPAPAAGSSAPAKAAEKAGADKAGTEAAVAAKGGRLGAAGSACELPVTFDLTARWKPKAIELEPDSVLADLAEQGTVKMVCEIDAKPAGNIGFLRVWQGEASEDDPQAVLKAFVEDDPDASEAAYTQVKAGALAAAEVRYTGHSELLEESKSERAFAVSTPDGPVVVHLGGMDTEEHTAMLPAFELAKKSLKLG
ncbi:lipoprotein [Streptomyces rubiginosohelvolus]|uniref:lipoprotein n=1 Tax=Streptomyces TaxID=1883 RepID=UPI0021B2027B|nr:lipoprotein [Streptomyces sp. CS-7]MCT6777271.1 lipoprotein [Streptomyces sp. CS-7]